MQPRYKPRFSSDRYLGQYERFDCLLDDVILIVRWGDGEVDEWCDDSESRGDLGASVPEYRRALEYCWDLARGKIHLEIQDPSVSPNAKI